MSCFAAQKNPQIVASAEKGEPQAQWSIGISRGTVGEPRTFRVAFLNSGCQGKNLGVQNGSEIRVLTMALLYRIPCFQTKSSTFVYNLDDLQIEFLA